MPYAYILRLGADGLDVCETCMEQALSDGSRTATSEAAIAVLQVLALALQRPPKTADLNGRLDFKELEARQATGGDSGPAGEPDRGAGEGTLRLVGCGGDRSCC